MRFGVKLTALVGVGVLALTLAGCESRADQELRLGKECAAAGGEWIHYSDGWGSGEFCRFATQNESPE